MNFEKPSHPVEVLPPVEIFYGDPASAADSDIGTFRQGSALSQWALSRYLIGRIIAEYVATLLYVGALVVLALAVLVYLSGPHWLGVLIGLVALGVLFVRWVFEAIVRRATGAGRFGPAERQLRRLVRETRSDVLGELRRIGVPGRLVTMPLLAWKLARSATRGETLSRLRRFEIARAVSPAHLDQLHLTLSETFGGAAGRRY